MWPIAARILLAAAALVAGGYLGQIAGGLIVQAVAVLTDRDVAELKDMLIAATAGGMMAGAAGAVWLSLALTKSHIYARRTAMVATLALGFLAGAGMIAGYDWPKASGHPVVEYELRLPASAPLPNMSEINLGIWRGKQGHGCYIREIRTVEGRPLIRGSFALGKDNTEPRMSLTLNRRHEGYWPLPVAPDARLEKEYRPWQRLEFQPSPRDSAVPLPSGDYEIRYRIRRYM